MHYNLRVYKINGHLCLGLPNDLKSVGLKKGDVLPTDISHGQIKIDFRKIVGRYINNCFKGPYYTEKDMEKAFGKYGWGKDKK